MKNVLITSVGSQNGINVIKSLKGKYNLISGDADIKSAGLWMTKRKYIFPKADNKAFMPGIMQVCKHEKIDVIFPTHSKDILVLSEFTDAFRELGLNMCLSKTETYLITDNKPVCYNVLRKAEIRVPKTYERATFPAMLKPVTGSGSKNTCKVENKEEYDRKKATGLFLSEFIEGQEYCVDGISDLDGKVISCLCRKRETTKGGICIKATTLKDEEMEGIAKKVVETLKLVGAWNVQFIKGKSPVVVDVNNRLPSGGTPLDIASGLDLPEMMVKLALGEMVIPPKLKIGKTMIRYYDAKIVTIPK